MTWLALQASFITFCTKSTRDYEAIFTLKTITQGCTPQASFCTLFTVTCIFVVSVSTLYTHLRIITAVITTWSAIHDLTFDFKLSRSILKTFFTVLTSWTLFRADYTFTIFIGIESINASFTDRWIRWSTCHTTSSTSLTSGVSGYITIFTLEAGLDIILNEAIQAISRTLLAGTVYKP